MLRNVSPFLNTCFIEDIKAIVSYLLTENVYDEGKKHKKIIQGFPFEKVGFNPLFWRLFMTF